jgi:hypothetical protein
VNKYLLAGAVLSALAALLHIGIIINGETWYRFFGAGEELAILAAQGSLIPTLITSGIALVLFIWALYAAAAGSQGFYLPLMKPMLVLISGVYLLRGLAIIPVLLLSPTLVDTFLLISSVICTFYGAIHTIGTIQYWKSI